MGPLQDAEGVVEVGGHGSRCGAAASTGGGAVQLPRGHGLTTVRTWAWQPG